MEDNIDSRNIPQSFASAVPFLRGRFLPRYSQSPLDGAVLE